MCYHGTVSYQMPTIQETTEDHVVTAQWAGCMSFDDIETEDDEEDDE